MEPWVPAAPRSRWQVVAVGLDGRVTVCRPGEPEAHLTVPASHLHPHPTSAVPSARGTDPVTSHQAAGVAARGAAGDRLVVLRLLGAHPAGLTDFELAGLAPRDARGRARQQTSLGKRRGELVHQGLVAAAPGPDNWRAATTGAKAMVWRITRTGRDVLAGRVSPGAVFGGRLEGMG
jgi:hypothetical protein